MNILWKNLGLKEFECSCGTDECLVKPKKKNGTIEICQEKRRRTRRSTITADEDSNHSVDARITRNQAKASSILNEKPKVTSIKNEPVEPQAISVETVTTPIKEEPEIKSVSDYETDEAAIGEKRKLTREERKLDAILRAFRQMEQAEKRKQLALEKQKSHHPKLEIPEEKPEEIKKEEKSSEATLETLCKDEEKSTPQTPKSKKGKRRRGSGTPSRRRTRTNSGGSDLLSLDEASPTKVTQSPETNSTSCNETVVHVPCSSPTPTSTLNLLSPISSTAPASLHILKTKRALMNEWLQEKSEAVINAPIPSPLPVHTEMNCNVPTHYVRCTKDTPHSSGISAAHLRRSNSATHLKPTTGQGSAKKRWLRQAMYDCHGCEIQIKFDPCSMEPPILDNGCLSPNSHGDIDSLNGVAEDVLTPLKKRRLMRESIESLPSPQSPSTATSIDDTDTTTVSNSLISDNSTEQGIDTVEAETCYIGNGKDLPPSPTTLKNSSQTSNEVKPNDCQENNMTVNENSEVCNETSFSSISSVELISDTCSLQKGTEPLTNMSDMSSSCKSIEEPLPFKQCENHVINNLNSNADSSLLETCTNVKSPSFDTGSPEEKVLSNTESSVYDVTSGNQSSSKEAETKKQDKEIIAQEQSLSVSAAITTISFVNNITDTEISNASYSCLTVENSDMPITTEQSPTSDKPDEDLKSEISNSSMQDNKDIFPNKNVKNKEICLPSDVDCAKLESPKTILLVNKHSGDSTNNSSKKLLNQTLYSSVSSCNNVVDISNCSDSVHVKDTKNVMDLKKIVDITDVKEEEPKENVDNVEETVKEDSQSRCTLNEDSNIDKKACASATKKRKVSLSEYRMRMKENSGKIRSNSEASSRTANSAAICAINLPNTLPEQVTLAPLPLFDKVRTRMPTSKQELSQTMIKKNETSLKNEVQEASEHRENLNERLKREFGFDVSEGGTIASTLKSKISGASNFEASEMSSDARPSPPPPPPPPRPRHIRPSMQASVHSSLPPSQFGFSAPPFPRPHFMVTQVPGAPYLQTQPPIVPHVHQLNTNTARCGLQPPLLPSTHPFSSSISGTLLRPSPSHDYSPVNAQRFAAMVQQPPPPPPHKSYLHVYPSVLYK